ncbi:MAG: ATP-binding protein [Spirochaetia bacterium]
MHFTCCDFITDCVQNSVEAGARNIRLEVEETRKSFSVRLADDGRGMTAKKLEMTRDPFFTTGEKHRRRVGLGIPFLVQATELSGGRFHLASEPGRGTDLSFAFDLRHVDSPPVGDVPAAFLQALCFEGDYEMEILRTLRTETKTVEYRLSRGELEEALGDLNDGASLKLLRDYLQSQEED